MAEKPKKDSDKDIDELFAEDFKEVEAELKAEEKTAKVTAEPEVAEVEEPIVPEEPAEEVPAGEVAKPREVAETKADKEVVDSAAEKKAAKKARREEKFEEYIYIIPIKFPAGMASYRRAGRAIREIRKYLVRHTKTAPDDIHIDQSINHVVWARGGKSVPPRIRVRAMKFEDGIVEAEVLTK